MTRAVTFTPSPDTITPGDLNTIQDDYEQIYQNYFSLLGGTFLTLQSSASPGNEWMLNPDHSNVIAVPTATNLSVNPFGTSMFYWNPEEWKAQAGNRNLKWRLRSTRIQGGTAALNAAFTVSVRRMTTNFTSTGTLPNTTIATFWESAAAATTSIIHSSSATIQTTDNQVLEIDAPASAGWYSLFMAVAGTPNALGLGFLYANLSLRMETIYPAPPTPSAATHVVGTGTQTEVTATSAVTVASTSQAVAVGDTVIVCVYARSANINLLSVVDSKQNTYVIDKRVVDPLGAPGSIFICRTVATTAMPTTGTITATFSTSFAASKFVIAMKSPGIALSPAGGSGDKVGTGGSYISSEAAVSTANTLLVGAAMASGNNPGITITPTAATFTELSEVTINNATAQLGALVVTTPGAYTYSGVISATVGWTSVLMAYEGA